MVMKIVSLAEALKLSVPERIQLAEDIWDSIASAPEALSLTKAQADELDRRLEDYRKNPQAGSPWDDVKRRIQTGR
jgi:putative addiction module component (TIGR02574 family)